MVTNSRRDDERIYHYSCDIVVVNKMLISRSNNTLNESLVGNDPDQRLNLYSPSLNGCKHDMLMT